MIKPDVDIFYPPFLWEKHPYTTEILEYGIRSLGSQEKVAEICGVTQKTVSEWLKRETLLPEKKITPLINHLSPRKNRERYCFEVMENTNFQLDDSKFRAELKKNYQIFSEMLKEVLDIESSFINWKIFENPYFHLDTFINYQTKIKTKSIGFSGEHIGTIKIKFIRSYLPHNTVSYNTIYNTHHFDIYILNGDSKVICIESIVMADDSSFQNIKNHKEIVVKPVFIWKPMEPNQLIRDFPEIVKSNFESLQECYRLHQAQKNYNNSYNEYYPYADPKIQIEDATKNLRATLFEAGYDVEDVEMSFEN